MERRKFWLSSIIKNSFLLPTRDVLANAASHFRHKAAEQREGLVSLYEDMEACGGYEDIQVMWQMIHSSSTRNVHKNRGCKKSKYWRFCRMY